MILLPPENTIIQHVLSTRFAAPGAVDQTFSDFDGVAYHVESAKAGPLTLSMDIRCWPDLVAQGAEAVLQREYGSYLLPSAETEQGYSVSLRFDYAAVPPEGAERDALVKAVALLKRNTMAAPFEAAFAAHKALAEQTSVVEGAHSAAASAGTSGGDTFVVPYREDEAIYILPSADRVTVVFSTEFKDETDQVFGKLFLQEFVDARRRPQIQSAPQVLYSNKEPPLEIRHVPNLVTGENIGYVTFVLFPRHFQTPERAYATVSTIQLFRDYLHYHIKCSKAYMQSRMRHRVSEFIKVLNRAKPEQADKERKTASGRTFRTR